MANKNIFFFYLLKIFDVSNMTILKCPSVTSRRDKFGHDIKIDIFSGKLWIHGWSIEFFYVLMTQCCSI